MERLVKFRDYYEMTADDFNNAQAWSQESDDHIVAEAIEPGRRFVGFPVSQKSTTEVDVGVGRLYFNGARHFTAATTTLDLNALRPNLQKKIVAIVAWPETVDTDLQERDYETDTDTGNVEPRNVAMESRRRARLEAVGGAEAVSPQPPVLESSVVVLAYVKMGSAGIESIERNDAAVLRSAAETADRVDVLDDFAEETRPLVSTLKSDMARLSNQIAQGGDKTLLFNAVSDIALIKAALDMPETFVGYTANRFVDEDDSNTGAAGYAARIEEGLRFPTAAADDTELALFNPFDPNVKKSGAGLVLPTYSEVERRVTRGEAGEVSLAQYAYEARTLTKLSMSRSRIRFGGDFEVSMGSAFWQAGTASQTGMVRTFQKAGETFQVYDTGKTDPEGYKIVRLAKTWVDTVDSPYWARLTSDENILGYAHVETFLNTQDGWVTALGPHIKRKPETGALTVGICETYRGEPDFERIRAIVTVQAADVVLSGGGSGAGMLTKIAIEPTFLEGGKRYGLFVVTPADFVMGVADASQPHTGTYFYGANGGVWETNPGAHLLWRMWTANFARPSVDVQLEPLQLTGGIQAIDILADSVIPASTDLVYSVQIGGQWRQLDDADPAILAGLPSLVPLRVTFVGTPDVMPGLRLTGSLAKFYRLATAAKHVSKNRALAANANKVTVKARMRGFVEANHDVTITVKRADNTVESADTVTDTTLPDGTVERVAVFNLGAATNGYSTTIDLATNSAANTFVVGDTVEIAE